MQISDIKKRKELIKSQIVDAFRYGENKILLKKPGKLIKQKLQAKVDETIGMIKQLESQLQQVANLCTNKPSEQIPDYWLEPYNDRLSTSQLIYGKSSQVMESDSSMGIQEQTDIKQKECMYAHDRIVRQIISRQQELIELQTLIQGIVDNQSYQLTIRQAAILGL